MNITFKNFEYRRSIAPIKIGDHYCTIITSSNGKLENLIVSKCLDEESSKFNTNSQNSFRLISTTNPEHNEIYETD